MKTYTYIFLITAVMLGLGDRLLADPPTSTYYQFNGASSVTVSSGTTITLGRLGSISTCAVTLGSGGLPYTAQLVLSDTGVHPGDVYFVPVSYPASANPTLQVLDSGTGGTVLHSSTGTAIAGSAVLQFVNVTGTAWSYAPKGDLGTRSLGTGVQTALGIAPNGAGGFVTSTGTVAAATQVCSGTGTLIVGMGSSEDGNPYTSATNWITSGGEAGNYAYEVAQSPWGQGNVTEWCEAVGGENSAQELAEFTSGTTYAGVTVPSPYSLATSGSYGKKYLILPTSPNIFNDAGQGINPTPSEANWMAITGSAHAAGYIIIAVVDGCIEGSASVPQGEVLNQYVRDGNGLNLGASGTNDKIVDVSELLTNQADTSRYPDNVHLDTTSHMMISSLIVAAILTNHNYMGSTYPGVFTQGITVYVNSLSEYCYLGVETNKFNGSNYAVCDIGGSPAYPEGLIGGYSGESSLAICDRYVGKGICFYPNDELQNGGGPAVTIYANNGVYVSGTGTFAGNLTTWGGLTVGGGGTPLNLIVSGSAQLVAGTVTVSNTNFNTLSRIGCGNLTTSGSIGAIYEASLSGTTATFNSTIGTSATNWIWYEAHY